MLLIGLRIIQLVNPCAFHMLLLKNFCLGNTLHYFLLEFHMPTSILKTLNSCNKEVYLTF